MMGDVMHPALAMWIWCGALSKPHEYVDGKSQTVPSGEGTDVRVLPRRVEDKPLPVPMLLRLDHMRSPKLSGLRLARFHSERYRNF